MIILAPTLSGTLRLNLREGRVRSTLPLLHQMPWTKYVNNKNYRGYRLTSKNVRWWLLLILLSVASIWIKLLKTNHTKESMIIGCNIWRICLELNWNKFFYDPIQILQLSKFVWTLRSSVWVVFNNFDIDVSVTRMQRYLYCKIWVWGE